MDKLARTNPQKLLDLLIARVMFERTGVKLYDAVIRKIEQSADARHRPMLATLRKHREEEHEHEEWLEAQIRALGGDPHQAGELARLEEEESRGIQSVILDGHGDLGHVLHALLAAELSDNAGWDLLVRLAQDARDPVATAELQKRMAEEARHLLFVREAVGRATERDVLGLEREMPTRPASALARALSRPRALITSAVGMAQSLLASRRRPQRTRPA